MLTRLLSLVADEVWTETQFGFLCERGTMDMVFVPRFLQGKCREEHRSLYIAFVNITKAFDTINRSFLWTILAKFGCPPAAVKDFHDRMIARVAYRGAESDHYADDSVLLISDSMDGLRNLPTIKPDFSSMQERLRFYSSLATQMPIHTYSASETLPSQTLANLRTWVLCSALPWPDATTLSVSLRYFSASARHESLTGSIQEF